MKVLTDGGLQIYDQNVKKLINDKLANTDGIINITDTTLYNSHAGGLVINNIKSKTEQNAYTGKNLLDCSGLSETTSNGVTFTPVYDANGSLECINVNGTASAFTEYEAVLQTNPVTFAAGNYIVNGCPNGGSESTYYIVVGSLTDGVTSRVSVDYGNSGTFELSKNTSIYLIIRVYTGTTLANKKFYPMISIEGGEYEPYVGGMPSPSPSYPQEIKSVVLNTIKTHGKNLLDLEAVTKNSTFDASGLINTSSVSSITDFILVSGKENVTISNARNDTYTRIACYYDVNKSFISSEEYSSKKHTFTVPSNAYYMRIAVAVNIENIQLEIGVEATEYQQYQSTEITLSEPIELNGFNGVYDVLTSDGVTRRFGVAVLDGTENYRMYNKCIACNVIDTLVKPADSNYIIPRILCERFIPDTPSNVLNGVNVNTVTVAIVNDTFRLRFHSDIFSSVEDAISYFSANPTLIVYELATPTTEELPTADTTALKNLKTFDEVTHVEVDCEGNPIIDMDYGCSKVGATALQNKNDIQIENNQNSFSNINVQMTASSTNIHSIPATNKSDIIKLSGGDNITLHPDVANKKVTVSHNESGVTAGTYNQVIVDKFGHVTNGNNLTYVHEAVGVAGTDGLVKIARLTITQGYVDTPIIIEINQRGKSSSTIIYIKFANSSNNDPTNASIRYMGVWAEAYIVKADASIWDIYIKKTEALDAITVLRYHNKLNGVSIEWTNELVTSVPSGAIQASECGSVERAMKLSNTDSIGSATQPVYFNASGVPVATTHRLETSVPSDAKFTDTTYGIVSSSTDGLCPKITNTKTKFLRDDGTWSIIENTNESKKQTEPTGQNIGDYWLLDY